MAALTWVPLTPLVWIGGQIDEPWLTALPTPVRAALTAGTIIGILQFVLMPPLVRLAAPWLAGQQSVRTGTCR
jgi:antibiotic biosynthesis monooxygenase (ABM) superfamily enzyme